MLGFKKTLKNVGLSPLTCLLRINWDDLRINSNGEILANMRFIVDIVLIAGRIDNARKMLERLQASRQVGLQISFAKIQIVTNLVLNENKDNYGLKYGLPLINI